MGRVLIRTACPLPTTEAVIAESPKKDEPMGGTPPGGGVGDF